MSSESVLESGTSGIITNIFSQLMIQYIQNVVTDISLIVSDEKKIHRDEIITLWNLVCPELEMGVKTKHKKTLDKICEYTGNKNGKCNTKVSVNSLSGKFCFRHIKHENGDNNQEDSSSDEKSPIENSENLIKDKKNFKIKFNRKAKLYLDEEFNYVFDRLTKAAYGKYVEGEIRPLSENDVHIIKINGGIIKE